MKNSVFTFTISILIVTGCYAQKNTFEQIDRSVLNFYRHYSTSTDPGEYAYLYENLPDSLPELCSLIKSQFIHPYGELNKYREQIPKERWNEMFRYPSVKSILEGLGFFGDADPPFRSY